MSLPLFTATSAPPVSAPAPVPPADQDRIVLEALRACLPTYPRTLITSTARDQRVPQMIATLAPYVGEITWTPYLRSIVETAIHNYIVKGTVDPPRRPARASPAKRTKHSLPGMTVIKCTEFAQKITAEQRLAAQQRLNFALERELAIQEAAQNALDEFQCPFVYSIGDLKGTVCKHQARTDSVFCATHHNQVKRDPNHRQAYLLESYFAETSVRKSVADDLNTPPPGDVPDSVVPTATASSSAPPGDPTAPTATTSSSSHDPPEHAPRRRLRRNAPACALENDPMSVASAE